MPTNKEIEQYFKDSGIDLKDIISLKNLTQRNNDLLQGGLRSKNVKNFRTIDTFNAQDSLDATYPMYIHLNISEDMTKIVSIKLSFWMLPFRAYPTTGIYEETNSPIIGFQISKDNGKTYGSILGNYTADTINLEIKDYIEGAGSYIVKFTSTTRARLSCQLTYKLDIIAR